MDPDLVTRLYRQLDALPIYDIHTHIRAEQPFATGLADVIGYHYYTELANSAQYRAEFSAETDREQVVRQVMERLPLLANTVQFDWLAVIGEEFLGIERRHWLTRSWAEIMDRAQKAIDAPDYRERVLRRSGVRRIYMTNSCDEPPYRLRLGLLRALPAHRRLCVRDGQAGREGPARRASGVSLAGAPDFWLRLEIVFRRFQGLGMAYAAISTVPNLKTRAVSLDEAQAIWERMLAGDVLDDASRMAWAAFALNSVAENCQRVRKPFHLMVGVRRGAYPIGVSGGRDLLDSVNSLAGYDYLFNQYPEVRFPTSVLAESMGLELTSSAWIRHNVYPSGHWWYLNNPVDIAREVRRRLDVVPAGKLVGYYSDAYCVEFILPKFRMYKYELACALAERMERSQNHPNMGVLSEDDALGLGQALLVDNPVNLFER